VLSIIIIIIVYGYTGNNMIVPVIIGATGIVASLEAIQGKHAIDSLQKTAVLGTSHVIQNVLQSETRSLTGGHHHHWFKRSTWDIQACDKRQR
jgi:1-deoxy-D-xylulose 5-phosphate reductoisomerase